MNIMGKKSVTICDDMKKQRYWEIGDRERIIVAAKRRRLVEWARTREVY